MKSVSSFGKSRAPCPPLREEQFPVTFPSSLAGDNLLLKWQVLADMLACSEHLVALLSRMEVVCKAKAFCLEGVKLAVKLQAIRW